eukprot:CAMPEP_0183386834 /NCGR_PEP_ID=MMETSP0370-20130417/2730_1 /TAXON_ID=268820 /ORGANISM="Peridinium aciculiferum, Strain PAER-2" /LENGTH=41 /DNA_ID= /DNA_START= /DNA_END= /DNA_ORIENTATION=
MRLTMMQSAEDGPPTGAAAGAETTSTTGVTLTPPWGPATWP